MKDVLCPGIPDSYFERSQVPMTKEEVRTVSLSKLRLTKSSVVYDIGSGSGSVAIECGRLSDSIKVFAIEIKEEALSLIEKNIQKFNLNNIQIVQALAPEKLSELPVPSHAFIGGSKGHLKEILESLYAKNPNMRIVFNAISIESLSQMTQLIKTFPIKDDEITQIQVSKTRKIGDYNMLFSNNPVFIFSFNFTPKV